MIPDLINNLPVVAHRPATLAPNEVCSVVICRDDNNEYTVWTWNRQFGGPHHGSYRNSLDQAIIEFTRRHGKVNGAHWTVANATNAEHSAIIAAAMATANI